ncbi:MAG: amidohydrolase family protein [Candidatus Eremiobacteraeota bacterium]|nr:amidohydrolase family protein [Candidatus Eremiobacteraeota bacterium]
MAAVAAAPALLLRARALITCDTEAPQQGITFEDLGLVERAAILLRDGRIAAMGERATVERAAGALDCELLDLPNAVIVPGFVDAHTHPLFSGNREPDFRARLRNEPSPLGMLYTVARTREALLSPERFWHVDVEPRLRAMLAHGTTTAEIKTGYALHRPGELELLDLLVRARSDERLPWILPTFLGAHALPPEFPDADGYVDYLIDQCLPYARVHGARYADAFCEPGFFSAAQTERYLKAAREEGLRLRVHCDEMQHGGAATMAIALGVDAIDHGNYMTDADVERLATGETVLVACPATIDYLGLERHAPVRSLLERGGRVALASDFNPGTSPCLNLQHIAYLGRKIFGLSAAEALDAVTRQAARSLRVERGVLRVGGHADIVALELDEPNEFGWMHGGNFATAVVRAGRVLL